ncbi:uncharacterized protein RSE6_11953 [Rhynchosporium secalis]|uniref:Uncharacterized protein n=1 Tax=Rhynchosporium secalis TaxID=38038 RepID=A0A1E1MQ58_RHYSE|nr:uncharacterized protein RSE6_11953 [Rhynchosporium secalis]
MYSVQDTVKDVYKSVTDAGNVEPVITRLRCLKTTPMLNDDIPQLSSKAEVFGYTRSLTILQPRPNQEDQCSCNSLVSQNGIYTEL